MSFQELKALIMRLFREYVKFHLKRLYLCLFLSICVAGTTAAIAWLLDPAVKKIFIDKNQTLAWLIPIVIIFTFAAKGLSLYFARVNINIVGYQIVCIFLKFLFLFFQILLFQILHPLQLEAHFYL